MIRTPLDAMREELDRPHTEGHDGVVLGPQGPQGQRGLPGPESDYDKAVAPIKKELQGINCRDIRQRHHMDFMTRLELIQSLESAGAIFKDRFDGEYKMVHGYAERQKLRWERECREAGYEPDLVREMYRS